LKFLVCSLLLLPAFAPGQNRSQELHRLFSEYYDAQLKENPDFATRQGRSEYNHLWKDWSRPALERQRRSFESYLSRLREVPLSGLPEQDQVSVRLLRYQLQQILEGEELNTYLLRVSQLYALHNDVYRTMDLMPSRTVKDYENIIARLSAVPSYIDQNIALLDEAIRRGLVQPRVVADRVIQQITAQMNQDADHTALLNAFRNFPSSIPESGRQRLSGEALAAYQERFLPAWRKLHSYMVNTYAPKARDSIAMTALPNGRKAYEYMVRSMTTTNLTPEQIHKLGEQEVRRIEAEMGAVRQEAGFKGTITEFEQELAASPDQHFRSKDEMLAYCRNVAKMVEPELPRLFKNLPRLLYGIRAIPEDREAAEASNAQSGAPDGSRPGWFNLNAYRPEKQVKYPIQALVLHEAVPGHILQGSVQQQIAGLPEFRKARMPLFTSSAYGEGWGLYAESLGAELGVYRDPASRFGQLVSERFRAVRFVVDTGLHTMGWSRQQALDYFQTHTPSSSTAEIDRYIGWPAQALSYKMGELKIKELRRTAEKELGSRFDIREFHDVILRDGALPLEMLEEQVAAYIKKQQK
jgi:uncharacterized protein (DUF885 family)